MEKPNPIITGNISSCTTKVVIYDLSYNSSNGIQINVQGGTFVPLNPNQIEVTWQNEGINKIELTESNIVGGIIGELLVDVKLLPNNNIIGNLNPSIGMIENYQVAFNNGINTYNWIVDPIYGQIISGQGTPNVQIQWNNIGSYMFEVVESNGNCEVSFFLTVNIN